MSYKFTNFCTWAFTFVFFSFLAVHFAHMKSPGQYRGVASSQEVVKPWYNASFKY